jgi:hypothetical protein
MFLPEASLYCILSCVKTVPQKKWSPKFMVHSIYEPSDRKYKKLMLYVFTDSMHMIQYLHKIYVISVTKGDENDFLSHCVSSLEYFQDPCKVRTCSQSNNIPTLICDMERKEKYSHKLQNAMQLVGMCCI